MVQDSDEIIMKKKELIYECGRVNMMISGKYGEDLISIPSMRFALPDSASSLVLDLTFRALSEVKAMSYPIGFYLIKELVIEGYLELERKKVEEYFCGYHLYGNTMKLTKTGFDTETGVMTSPKCCVSKKSYEEQNGGVSMNGTFLDDVEYKVRVPLRTTRNIGELINKVVAVRFYNDEGRFRIESAELSSLYYKWLPEITE
jgi:hypothetical protein